MTSKVRPDSISNRWVFDPRTCKYGLSDNPALVIGDIICHSPMLYPTYQFGQRKVFWEKIAELANLYEEPENDIAKSSARLESTSNNDT